MLSSQLHRQLCGSVAAQDSTATHSAVIHSNHNSPFNFSSFTVWESSEKIRKEREAIDCPVKSQTTQRRKGEINTKCTFFLASKRNQRSCWGMLKKKMQVWGASQIQEFEPFWQWKLKLDHMPSFNLTVLNSKPAMWSASHSSQSCSETAWHHVFLTGPATSVDPL